VLAQAYLAHIPSYVSEENKTSILRAR